MCVYENLWTYFLKREVNKVSDFFIDTRCPVSVPNAVSTVKPTGRIGPSLSGRPTYTSFSPDVVVYLLFSRLCPPSILTLISQTSAFPWKTENGVCLSVNSPLSARVKSYLRRPSNTGKVALQPIPRSSRRFICYNGCQRVNSFFY